MAEIAPAIMRPEDAARFLTLKKQRLARLRFEGSGPAFVKVGRSVLYRRDDLEAWLTACRRRSTSDGGAS